MRILFLCSISPVQDFITTARRSHDLWFGSKLLSELSKAVARFIADEYGDGSLVFPNPEKRDDLDPDSDFSVSNRICATLEIDEFTDTFSEKIREAMFKRLEQIRKVAFSKVKNYTEKMALKQVEDLPEFYWAAVPYESDEEYSLARKKAEIYLAARKNTRDFKQIEGADRFKSSLDGIRESVIIEDAYPKYNDDDATRQRKNANLYRNYHAKPGEQLSGVDLLKRMGTFGKEPEFLSTSDFAAEPFFERINGKDKSRKKEREIISKIKDVITSKGWQETDITENRALVYPSRLIEFFSNREDLEIARNELEKILNPYVEDKIRPDQYYALLIADGDSIGELFSSKKKKEEHRTLSTAISKFAVCVPPMIKEKYKGTCIYAGGEDVLAYLPLHTALDCARDLEKTFDGEIGMFSYTDREGNIRKPTLSGAIIIAHHLTPLSEIFKLARSAEREAKKVKDKNTLVVVHNTRSGSKRRVKDKWSNLYKRLIQLVEYINHDWISKGTAFELYQMHREFIELNISGEGIINEALRIVNRKRQSGGEKSLPVEVKNQFELWLSKEKIPVGELAQEMIIAKEFAAAKAMAGESIQEGG